MGIVRTFADRGPVSTPTRSETQDLHLGRFSPWVEVFSFWIDAERRATVRTLSRSVGRPAETRAGLLGQGVIMSLLTEPGAAWHTVPVEACLERLHSARGGLTRGGSRTTAEGARAERTPGRRRTSPWTLLLDQFRNVLIVILLIAVALSAVLGHGVEAVAIAVIVLFAALLGFVQEYRAERSMEALREMAAPTATVLRDGEETEVPRASWCPAI